MAEWKRISPLDIVWQGFWRVYVVVVVGGGGTVAVVKCRVSINGEMREGGGEERRTGAGQCRRTIALRWVVEVGGVEGRNVSSQQAGVVTSECQTNKLLTLTNTSAAWGYS